MTEDNLISNDPYAAGILIVGDAKSIRRVDGTGNNLTEINRTVGSVGTRLRRLTPIEYEDGLASPAGVAFDAAGNQLLDQNGFLIERQPIPIYSQEEAQRLLAQRNTENLSNNPRAPFVLVNPPDRPSAREISNSISKLEQGEELPDPRGLSAMIWSFGQFVNHETDLAQTGGDLELAEDILTDVRELNFPIAIPEDDPNFSFSAFLAMTGGDEDAARELIEETEELEIIKDEEGNEVLGSNGLPLTEFEFERDAFAPETGTIRNDIPGVAVNTITAWLDLSTVYGSDPLRKDFLRETVEVDGEEVLGAKLKVIPTLTGDLLPTNAEEGGRTLKDPTRPPGPDNPAVGYLAGDIRVNENNSLAAQHTLWVRNHNRLADELAGVHLDWTQEELFERARQINIAQFQNILLYEWLPSLIGGNISPYKEYNPTVDPQTSDTFVIAALRIGHTLVNNSLIPLDDNGVPIRDLEFLSQFNAPGINLDGTWEGEDIDALLRGFVVDRAEAVDTNVVFDLRNALIPGVIGLDLLAANIQRGRDRGLADYNQLRRNIDRFAPSFGNRLNPDGTPNLNPDGSLPPDREPIDDIQPFTSFAEITSDPELQAELEQLYGTVEDIDMWVGLFAEDPVEGSSVGRTVQAVLRLQYERMRDGDRFWFENPIDSESNNGGYFTEEEIEELRQTTLAKIISLNTDIPLKSELEPGDDRFALPDNVFFVEGIIPGPGEEVFLSSLLTGDQEVPNPVSTAATGTAELILNEAGDALKYSLKVSGLDFGAGGFIPGGPQTPGVADDDVTMLHFHNAPRGENGDVVFGIISPDHDLDDRSFTLNSDGSTTIEGIWEETDDNGNQPLSNFVSELRGAQPGEDVNLYFNVHTEGFPAGEIRGQIFSPTEPTDGVIKLEAEELALDTYLVENNSFASGEALISLRGAGPSGTTGTASGEFTGPSGLYDVVVGYFDDNDGKGLLRFSVNDNLVDNWSLDQDLGFDFANDKTFQQRTIGGVELNTGDQLAIQGTSDVSDFPVGDFARVDFFKLLPRSIFGTDTPFQSLNAGPAGLA